MSLQTWQETLVSAQVAGTTLVSSTAATSIIPPAARYTLPSNYFSVGKILRIKAAGQFGNGTAASGNLTLAVNLGTVATPIIVFTSGAFALNTTTLVLNQTWALEIVLTCRAIGAATSANIIGVGALTSRMTLGQPVVATNVGVWTAMLPDTAPVVGTGFDSTITNVVDLFATFSASAATNSITLLTYTLESLN